MPGFDVTPAELQATSALLGQVSEQARIELARLGGEAGALLDGGWRGQAAAGFEHGWASWRRGAADILDSLEAIARLLAVTGQDYDAAEADSMHALNGAGGQWR